jgi:PIN domain nuclease of toxin-antitoxin system
MEKMKYILDACALLAFLNKEDGWDKVTDLLTEAIDTGEVEIYMSIVNLLEIYYDRLHLEDSENSTYSLPGLLLPQ